MTQRNVTLRGSENVLGALLLASLLGAAVGCGSPNSGHDPGSADAGDSAGIGDSIGTATHAGNDDGQKTTTPAKPEAADTHPSWLVGTYLDPGKVEDNISSNQKSFTLAADGTYTGFYCKSCGNQPGKWSVADGELVFDGGSFGGSAKLTDFSANCRILSYVNTRFYREGLVPNCPTAGDPASGDECAFVGSYQSTGSGDVSDTIYVSVEPDHFYYVERSHTYCVSNEFGSKCLLSVSYEFDTWSFSNDSVVGPPTKSFELPQGRLRDLRCSGREWKRRSER